MKVTTMLLHRALLALPALLLSFSAAFAADPYPVKPVEIVVPWPPGGGSDSLGRAIAEATKPHLSQPTLVVNKPGASGTIGFAYTTAGAPEGYKIVLLTPEVLLAPLMGIGRGSAEDFLPIARFTDDALSVTVRADAPWNTVEEFLAYAKQNPGKVTISTAGNGTMHHVGAAALTQATGIGFVVVPYQGTAPALMGLLSGDVVATTAAYAELSQYVASGKMKTLAVMSSRRLDTLPNVPTMKERGHDLQYSTWRGIAVAKATPQPVVDQWRGIAKDVSQSQAFKEVLAKLNLNPAFADSPEFSAAVFRQADDFKKLTPYMKKD